MNIRSLRLFAAVLGILAVSGAAHTPSDLVDATSARDALTVVLADAGDGLGSAKPGDILNPIRSGLGLGLSAPVLTDEADQSPFVVLVAFGDGAGLISADVSNRQRVAATGRLLSGLSSGSMGKAGPSPFAGAIPGLGSSSNSVGTWGAPVSSFQAGLSATPSPALSNGSDYASRSENEAVKVSAPAGLGLLSLGLLGMGVAAICGRRYRRH